MTLEELGWREFHAAAFTAVRAAAPGSMAAHLEPARIAVHHKNHYLVYVDGGELTAVARGRLRSARPVVGDWVGITRRGGGDAVIEMLLPRAVAFSRKVAGRATEAQVIAANVDVVWVVTGADGDLNPRRIERYLTIAWEGGARPVIVVTKVDLVPLTEAMRGEIAANAPGVPVHGVSNVTREGLDELRPYLERGCTVALLGSSGVGKSTLVNELLGELRQVVNEVRVDGKGRHTTTRRELVPVPGGGLLLDTPGMRELAPWEADDGLGAVFEEIERLALECRFGDCRHGGEPGCRVLAAVESGEIAADRLASYRKLADERAALERRKSGGRGGARARGRGHSHDPGR